MSSGSATASLLKLDEAFGLIQRIEGEIRNVIVGQDRLIARLLIALFSKIPYSFKRGEIQRAGCAHVLLEGVPGLAKTLVIMALSNTIRARFQRIQFTPDLLPADIVGTRIYDAASKSFRIEKGPIFAHMILADEINRATPKTQSALLEAMQERQVTIGEETYSLEDPFWVTATQNPVEQEGVYALPEAQADRFAMKIKVEYPSHQEELNILRSKLDAATVEPIIRTDQVIQVRELVSREIYVDEKIEEYIVRLGRATRNSNVQDLILYGISPRAYQHILALSRTAAFFSGREYVIPADVKGVAVDAMRHRLVRTLRAEAENISVEEIIEDKIFRAVSIP
ncbi:MAG: AAA family ATPase [Acidobacteria bacterium]|nr:AAA family ATPase [Acidobacteriota bacterium]